MALTRRGVLLLMSASIFLGYLPWYNFSAVLPVINRELGLTGLQIGSILGAFQAGYVIVVLITGWLSDRVENRLIVLVGTLGVAVCSTAFPILAKDFITVLILRTLTGIFAGAIYAPGMALLSKWFLPKERGFAIGAYTGALIAAFSGAYFVAGPIAASSGWEMGILYTSIPAFLGAILIAFVPKDSPPLITMASTAKERRYPQEKVLNVPSMLVTGAYMGHMWEVYALCGWIGPAMVSAAVTGGLTATEAATTGNQMAALIILLGAPAPWLGGALSDKIGRSAAAGLCLLLSAPASLLFGWLIGGSFVYVLLLGLWYGFWSAADSAIYKVAITDLVNVKIIGLSLGLQSALGYGVTIISPQVFGAILDATNKGTPTAVFWGPAFAILAIGPIIGFVLLALQTHFQRSLNSSQHEKNLSSISK